MKKNLIRLSGFSVGMGVSVAPFLALAQGSGQVSNCSGVTTVNNLFDFICKLQNLLNAIVPFAIALGVIYLIWGIINYVVADEEEAKKKGRDRIIYGIIGLAIIFAVWGLIAMVSRSFGVSGGAANTTPLPCLPGQPC